MGVGGLDSEFNAIFRRAFASRVFSPEIIEQIGTYLPRLITPALALIWCLAYGEQFAFTGVWPH